MWKAFAIAVLGVAVLAGSGAAALHRYDASRSDRIAEGMTIAGIDVGGLSLPEARALLERQLERRIERPIALTYKKRRFVVEPGLVDVSADPEPALRAALEKSRDGNFLTRSWRDLVGDGEAASLPVPIEYSREAVARVVAGVRRAVDRPVREAKSSVSFAGVSITPSSEGVAVRSRVLRRTIAARLSSPDAPRRIAVPVARLKPKVTTKELQEKYRTFIAISRSSRELRLFVNQRLVKTYRVGIGAAGFATPAGIYQIQSKAADPAWYVPNKPWAGELAGQVIPAGDPRNPIKARWLGFYDGAGIHGTADLASIGTAASHGCIRMIPGEVIELSDRVPLHTPLYIA
jgi:lipoprotein-anchoring transpeptidase ErfK/SrfK